MSISDDKSAALKEAGQNQYIQNSLKLKKRTFIGIKGCDITVQKTLI